MLYMHTESAKKSNNIETSCSPSLYLNTGSFRGPIFNAAKINFFFVEEQMNEVSFMRLFISFGGMK